MITSTDRAQVDCCRGRILRWCGNGNTPSHKQAATHHLLELLPRKFNSRLTAERATVAPAAQEHSRIASGKHKH